MSLLAALIVLLFMLENLTNAHNTIPPPPIPESVSITELPLPPIAPNNDTGACTQDINPLRTGCILNGVFNTFQSGDFLPDGKHVLAQVIFGGAPVAPDEASIYSGMHVIIIKTDAEKFPNGSPWKCLTCGVPSENAIGTDNSIYDYPQAFRDGKRLLIGKNVLSCGNNMLASQDCVPERTFIYPLRWNVAADGSGPTGAFREQRLHPDQVHIGYNALSVASGSLEQYAYFGRLVFNPKPTMGEPMAPRYDIVNVSRLQSPDGSQAITTKDKNIFFNPNARVIGEARGFNGDGSEITYIGGSVESCNIDVFAAHLETGAVRRLTSHPEYCDPIAFSPDNKWMAIMDTRGSGRNMFIAGMRGIPPMVDIVSSILPSSTRNNGVRRFFEPYLLDYFGDRENYYGQKINGGNDGTQGSGDVDDPEWNGMADPRWSLDSTRVAFWQTHTISPSCGNQNPLPCYPSTEPGGRNYRMYLAVFRNRKPTKPIHVEERSDTIPWGVPYVSGMDDPPIQRVEAGTYTLAGKAYGSAEVNITWLTRPNVGSVAVTYSNYSDDGKSFLYGHEKVTLATSSPLVYSFFWLSDIQQNGAVNGSKRTSLDGYNATINVEENIIQSNGTLVTTLDGVVWSSPQSST